MRLFIVLVALVSALPAAAQYRHHNPPPPRPYIYVPAMPVYVPPPRSCLEKRYTGRWICDPYRCGREYIVINHCYRRY
jgi:hypothetical protein